MGACVASRLGEEEEVVSICRERKQQLKLAVEKRYTLADAHYRYCQSLNGVSAAISLFVARHSTASSPFMITFPPPSSPQSPPKENIVSNPLFLQQTPSEPTKQAIPSQSYASPSTEAESSSSEEEEEEEMQKDNQPACGYFYMEQSSSQQNFGWDYFNPFTDDVKPEIISRHNRLTEEDFRILREQEGIPELEEDEEKWEDVKTEFVTQENSKVEHENKVEVVNVKSVETSEQVRSQVEQKGITVIDTPVRGRELLEALKDIEDYFLKAYDSGKEVSRMLEVNRVQLQSNLEEIKESSTKIIQAISWRSSLSRSSSCKSLVASSSKSSSTWTTEFKNDLFDDYGGMDSGSHSLTLGRLYAWEKKLYEEVKAGDDTRKIYEKKCNVLRNQDARGDEGLTVDKTRAAVKDLYSRILVAIRRAETIAKRIEKLRDEELQPQVNELLLGMMRSWKVMLESHEIQNKIMFEVKTFTCPTYGKFFNDSHRLATLQLETELLNWRTCFSEYVAAQKAYVEAMHGWLTKFIVPEVELYSKGRSSAPPCRANGPPLFIICRDWLACTQRLPKREVSCAIKFCAKDVRALWIQQGEEHKQKRKVVALTKELERKVLAMQKVENSIGQLRLTEHKMEEETDHQDQSLIERKDYLNDFRRKVELEKEVHKACMLETQKITLNGFQTGFCRVFESMKEFSMASYKMYSDLLSKNSDVESEGSTAHYESFQPQVGNNP